MASSRGCRLFAGRSVVSRQSICWRHRAWAFEPPARCWSSSASSCTPSTSSSRSSSSSSKAAPCLLTRRRDLDQLLRPLLASPYSTLRDTTQKDLDAGRRASEGVPAVPGKLPEEISPWPLLKQLWPTDPGHNARIAFALSGLFVGKALAVYAPVKLGHLVDSLGAGVEALPIGILAAYGLARLSSSAFNELRQALFASVSQSTVRLLARRCFEHVHSLDAAYLLSSKPGALSVICTRATKALQQVMTMLLFQVFPVAVEFCMALAVMATVAGPECAAATTATIGLYLGFTTYYSNKRRSIMRRSNKAEEDANAVFLDSLTNCEVIKMFQSHKAEAARYDKALRKYELCQIGVLKSLATLNFGQQIIVVSGFTSILAITAAQVLAGSIPVGDVVAINGLLTQLMGPLGILGGVYRVTTQGFIDLGKISGLLQMRSAMPLPEGGGCTYDFRGGHIEFRDVHFRHNANSPILAGLSLQVEPGTKVAIIGPSGSGKTTLLKLLYRLVDPQQGQVLLDGQDVSQLAPESFRSHLGIVPQDCTLFNETVGFNIRYGRPDATQEEMERAARQAQVHSLIEEMPEGYDTPVGDRGLKLSGGERQRIGIARCLVRNPSIVVLDEATSALDVQTERHLAEEIDELAEGRTCLVVAHRLSTVMRCDEVAYLEDGVVVERGPHDVLMETSARYKKFWEGRPAEA
eukprot:TRINITY_DN33507_c0_g1_i1.p1 TRINITY_DN33507_c0_g1~~TRINITY_DN33507_c0_g1_i1.p1  ORF type:complete len:717 (-),score=120.42 TRINITY_DN33507_c0_g1_i1:184-2262(-)